MPVVVLDYTRSDDQWTEKEIRQKVGQAGLITGLAVDDTALSSYSLTYAVRYRHSGVALADALKTSVSIEIRNAPPSLSSLLNVRQIVGQESALSLGEATKRVIDAQNQFPLAVWFFKVEGPGGIQTTISKKFMIYKTGFNFDQKRVNSTLVMQGASFEDMVMRVRLNLSLNKESFLVDQLQAAFASTGYQITPSDTGIAHQTPVLERFYPPAPLNKILAAVCLDNGLWFDLDETNKKIKIQSLDSANPPKTALPKIFCFRGTPPGQYIVSGFSVQDYATAQVTTELTAVELFDTLRILDDSGGAGLFDNFRSEPGVVGLKRLLLYSFYVLSYEYSISSTESVLRLGLTNNWLLSNFKLDTLFENAVYSGIK